MGQALHVACIRAHTCCASGQHVLLHLHWAVTCTHVTDYHLLHLGRSADDVSASAWTAMAAASWARCTAAAALLACCGALFLL